MSEKKTAKKRRRELATLAAATVIVGQVTGGSGIPQYVAVVSTAWRKEPAVIYRAHKREAADLFEERVEKKSAILDLREARNTPYYVPTVSPFPTLGLQSSFNAALGLISQVPPPILRPAIPAPPTPWRLTVMAHPSVYYPYQPLVAPFAPTMTAEPLSMYTLTSVPFMLTAATAKSISVQRPAYELPQITYTAAVNGLELPVQYGEFNLERGFSSVVCGPFPKTESTASGQMQEFDLEMRFSMFSPDYFKVLVPEPDARARFITDLLICAADEDIDPEVLDSIIPFWKEICEEVIEALSDPEKFGEAIAEWIVQHPLETGLGFLLWLIKLVHRRVLRKDAKDRESLLTRLLRRHLPKEDSKAGKSWWATFLRKYIPEEDPRPVMAAKMLQCFGNEISAIEECLKITKMRLKELTNCAKIPEGRIGQLLGYLKATSFIFQDTARFYSLGSSQSEAA